MQGPDGALYIFYTGAGTDGCSVRVARSADPLGRPGTWYKYYEGAGRRATLVHVACFVAPRRAV